MNDSKTTAPRQPMNVPAHAETMALRCAGCGANLEVEPGVDHLTCGFCRTQQEVIRRGGGVRLQKLEDAVSRVQRGTDRMAAELAIPRLERELLQVEAERKRELSAPLYVKRSNRLANAVIFMLIASVVAFFCLISLAAKGDTEGLLIKLMWVVWLAGLAGSAVSWVLLRVRQSRELADAKRKRDTEVNEESSAAAQRIRNELAEARSVVSART